MDTNYLETGETNEVRRSDEIMGKIFKRSLVSGRADKCKEFNQNIFSCSNAIYFGTSPFYQLSANAKSILGIKKASCANN